ncbi:kininogen-1 isoform X2 [Gadus morhua]|uniref:kininogen-1 isoform X2 n=1 Tax=Gadus morhua TaxID=8049 RepID=UPI0011B3887D|nr:kininogen-1-like isoform X2 [Gadus morhua]
MNRAAAGLCVLGLLCLHGGGVLGQDLEAEPEALVFCDNALVSKVAKAAVTSFNEKISTGNMVALYQILSASKAENASGVMYSIKFNSRRSDCPAGGAVTWTDCGYLADDSKEPIMCNATVYVSEGATSTQVVECDLGPVKKDRRICMGCPVELDLESEELKVPVAVSISKYNPDNNHTHLFMLNSVGYATRQVVAGLRYSLYFDMRKSNCSKADNPNLHSGCVHDSNDVLLANCNSTVDIAEWRHEVPQANLECDEGAMDLKNIFNRRRPPGWSPLRSDTLAPKTETPFISLDPSALPPALPSNRAPPPGKEDSSEEEVSQDDPFHCPSKPWKEFSPPAPPSRAESGGPDAPLTDLDLLG